MNCKIGSEMRLWFVGPILFLWGGIYFTGFDLVHWLLYIPATLVVFAFVSGRCPGMLLIRYVMKYRGEKS